MTERKPPDISFESWVDKQIREAADRGAFDDLPGAGKPLPGLDEPYDETWWLQEKMRREDLSYLPPTLALRKEAQEAVEAARRARTEAEVRRIVTGINARIRKALAEPPAGPPLNLAPYDVERIVEDWRARVRARQEQRRRRQEPAPAPHPSHRPAEPRRRTWFFGR